MDTRNLQAFDEEFFSALPRSQSSLAQARQRCFQMLDGIARRVIRLHRFEGFGFPEIADCLAKKQDEVEAIWYDALRSLRRSMAAKGRQGFSRSRT